MNAALHRSSIAFAALVLGVTVAAAESRTYSLLVEGLVCPLCAYSAKRNLGAIAGVEEIEIDYRTGKALVTMADGVTLDEVEAREAIESAGFELRLFEEVESSPQQ